MYCDVSKFRGGMDSVDVLKIQMDDMLKGNTIKAYQLASPKNRKSTADSYNKDKFDNMVRSTTYAPLLNAEDYSYHRTNQSNCTETFDVLLYAEDNHTPTHGYEFSLSRQIVEDLHDSLEDHKLPANSQYWRTDHVLPIPNQDLQAKHNNMIKKRQESLRKACFYNEKNMEAHKHHSVQHSFGEDMTHNLCCRLGEESQIYSNISGNPIGEAAKKLALITGLHAWEVMYVVFMRKDIMMGQNPYSRPVQICIN